MDLWLLDELAESRINDALQSGEFNNLPGAGERVHLKEDPLVPEELRVAYRLLKMSGHIPQEISLLHEIRGVEQFVFGVSGGEQKSAAARRLNLLRAQLGVRAEHLVQASGYATRVISRLDGKAHA